MEGCWREASLGRLEAWMARNAGLVVKVVETEIERLRL